MPAPAPTCPAAAIARIACRLTLTPTPGWTPPLLSSLIDRIDAALADRRSG